MCVSVYGCGWLNLSVCERLWMCGWLKMSRQLGVCLYKRRQNSLVWGCSYGGLDGCGCVNYRVCVCVCVCVRVCVCEWLNDVTLDR